MHVLFENNIDEIPQVIQICKKNKNSLFFEFKNTKSIHVDQFNNTLCNSYTNINASLYMRLISKEGYIIDGKSNRLYLSDVMSRLYQSLENLLKTNKGHKVRNKIDAQVLPTVDLKKATDKISDVTNAIDPINFTKLLNEIYSGVSDDLKASKNISLSISGDYDQCLTGNSLGEKKDFENILFIVSCEIYSKTNPSLSKKFVKKLQLKDLKTKEIYISKFSTEITKYASELEG